MSQRLSSFSVFLYKANFYLCDLWLCNGFSFFDLFCILAIRLLISSNLPLFKFKSSFFTDFA